MSSAAPRLLGAGSGRQSRSASSATIKAASGFHVFRVDGYSLSKTAPGGERISSSDFAVGGRRWRVDFYPNGTDKSKDESDAISLYLVLSDGELYSMRGKRLGAQYEFSLLDAAGNAAYELPAEKGIFKCSDGSDDSSSIGCGYATFISKGDLERRRTSLLKDDCLAIRCDVGVAELETRSIGEKHGRSGQDDSDSSSTSHSDSDESPRRNRGRRRRQPPQLDDKEYIRRCLGHGGRGATREPMPP